MPIVHWLSQGMGEKRAENSNFGRFTLRKMAVLAHVLAFYGYKVIPHAIWQCQVVTRSYKVVLRYCQGVA